MVLYAPDGPGRAAEEHPRVQDSEDGVQWDKPPETKPERVESLRVRSLRTQQRAESQCQASDPFCGFLWVDGMTRASSSRFSPGCEFIYGEFDPGSGRTLAACLRSEERRV